MAETHSSPYTSANAITLVRLGAAPALGAAVLCGASLAAASLFVLAVASDFADGAVARRRGESSALGGFLDHATDALFCTLGLAALSVQGLVTPFLPLAVALAFTQYALDSRIVEGRALRTSGLGRWNGIAYYVLVGVPVIRDVLGLGWPGDAWVRLAAWALLVSTGVSMGDRAVAWWQGRR